MEKGIRQSYFVNTRNSICNRFRGSLRGRCNFQLCQIAVSKACSVWSDEAKLKSNRFRRTLGFDAISNSAIGLLVRVVAIELTKQS
jgi:hypothetical protein